MAHKARTPLRKKKTKENVGGSRCTVKKGGSGEDRKNPNRAIGTREGQTRPFQQSMVGRVTEGHAYAKGGTPAKNPGQDGQNVSVCEPTLMSVSSLQTLHRSSNIVESPTQLEAHLVHQGPSPRTLRSEQIMAPTKVDSGDALSHGIVPNTNITV